MKRHVLFGVGLALIASLTLAPAALATSDTFSQQILPLDCIFTVINVGTGELYYVTPAQCGVNVNSTNTTPAPAQPAANRSQSAGGSVQPQPVLSEESPNYKITGTTGLKYPPWKPLFSSYKAKSVKPSSGFDAADVVVVVVMLLFIGLIVFVY